MIFSSIPFLFFFFPLFLIVYYISPQKMKNYVLLFFSLIFYAWGEPIYIILMVISCFINYLIAIMVEKYSKKKLLLIISILLNILIIGFFKYGNFLIINLNNLFNLSINKLNLSLPIGISFYTFQTMSYVIDVYRKEVKVEKNFFTFMTYVSMFPQLIAGPIVRYETVNKELYKRKINFENYYLGMIRFLEGLFKKVIIANNVGYLWNIIISNQANSIMTSILGVIAYSLQIYFDFSGYSDMAIGMGKMLGFNYLENFNYPYIADSITDFWRRWHISLSSWFKDYVYIPLGGSRCGKVVNIRNILIVWILTGVWHGANWNFIIWGLYFGIILVIEKFVVNKYLSKWPSFFKHLYALLLIMIGWLIFAFDDVNILLNYISNLFRFDNIVDRNFIFYITNYGFIILAGIIFSMPIYPKIKEKLNNKYGSILLMIIYIILFVISISFLVSDTYNPFLYFRF